MIPLNCRGRKAAFETYAQCGAEMSAPLGHKRSQHFVEAEAYRRIMAGQAPATLADFAKQLSDWLQASYPDASPMTLIEIENQIRDTWHRRHELIRGGDP